MTTSRSDALVLFGVTGDLAHKMIFPALYAMAKRGALKVPVIGVGFPKWSLARLVPRRFRCGCKLRLAVIYTAGGDAFVAVFAIDSYGDLTPVATSNSIGVAAFNGVTISQ